VVCELMIAWKKTSTQCGAFEYTIYTGSATPIRQNLRRHPVAYQRQIDEHVHDHVAHVHEHVAIHR